MDIEPILEIVPENLYGYIDTIEIDYKTEKDNFVGTFNSRTLTLKLIGIEENSIPDEVEITIGTSEEDKTKLPAFIIVSYEYDPDTKTATLKGNDYAIKFDEYFDLELTYPLNLGQLASAICGTVEVGLNDINFDNHDFIMNTAKVDSKYTYREIVGMIASAMGGIAFINNNNELVLKKLTIVDTEIENVFEQKVDGEKIGPINYVSLNREPITDAVYLSDETSISTYGRTAIQIVNNYLVDDNRENAIQKIYDNLHNFEFYPANINTYQGYKFEPFDITVLNNKNILITNINIKYPLMLDGFAGSEQLSKTEVKHNAAKGIEKQIIDAQAQVDRVEGQIELVVQEQTKVANNIEELEENGEVVNSQISQILVTLNNITSSVNFSGGSNKVKNSVGLFGSDLYTITDTTTTTGIATFGEVGELKGVTNSGAMVYACNKKIVHEPVELVTGQEYTITFKYSNKASNHLKIVLTPLGDDEIVLVDTTDDADLDEVSYTFIASGNAGYYIESSYLDDSVGGFYTDLIIAEGNMRMNWEPANGEYMGTNFSIYYNGIEITSDTSNIKTTMNNLGMNIVDSTNSDKIILTVNNLRVLLTNTEIDGYLKIKSFLWEQKNINGDECLILT